MKRLFKIALAVDAITLTVGLLIIAPLMFGGRLLTEEEILLAESIFADGLDLDGVRINEGGLLTWFYPGVTTGNIISFPTGTFDFSNENDKALFLHELTHVWQYQHSGWGYLPKALFEEVTEDNAYVVHYDAAKEFSSYDLEEQAEIVAEYFLTKDERYEIYIEALGSNTVFP